MVKLDRKSTIALNSLDDDDRDLVQAALATLEEVAGTRRSSRSPAGRVVHLPSGVEMLTVTPTLAVMFREESGDILVEDIFPPERLRILSGGALPLRESA
jgi:hypothetical protein